MGCLGCLGVLVFVIVVAIAVAVIVARVAIAVAIGTLILGLIGLIIYGIYTAVYYATWPWWYPVFAIDRLLNELRGEVVGWAWVWFAVLLAAWGFLAICDIANSDDRTELLDWLESFPGTLVLAAAFLWSVFGGLLVVRHPALAASAIASAIGDAAYYVIVLPLGLVIGPSLYATYIVVYYLSWPAWYPAVAAREINRELSERFPALPAVGVYASFLALILQGSGIFLLLRLFPGTTKRLWARMRIKRVSWTGPWHYDPERERLVAEVREPERLSWPERCRNWVRDFRESLPDIWWPWVLALTACLWIFLVSLQVVRTLSFSH